MDSDKNDFNDDVGKNEYDGKGGARGPACTTPAVRNGAAKLKRRGTRIK